MPYVAPVGQLNVAPGSIVTVRDAEWLVTQVEATKQGLLLSATGMSELVRDTRATFYEHLDRIEPFDPRRAKLRIDTSPKYRTARLWLEATLRKTAIPLGEDNLTVSTKMLTNPLGYQRKAVKQALSADNLRPRLLLADTVGLGKTIEIGMILSELSRRGRGERILIVTPKHVLEQMQFEMWTRFGLPFVRLDSVGIQRVRQKLPATRNPFSLYKRAIISIDTLKQERYLNHLRTHQWDAVVIDESHNLTGSSTQNNALARVLAPNTEALILASATPHNGKPESFAELIRLLEPTAVSATGEVDQEAVQRLVIRRHRYSPEVEAEVGDDWAERKKLQHFLVDAAPAENAVAAELADVWLYPQAGSSPYSGSNAGLFPWTLAKAYLSSPLALLDSVRNRISTLTSGRGKGDTRRPSGDSGSIYADYADAVELSDAQRRELEALERLEELAETSTREPSAKLTQLIGYLKQVGVAKNSDKRVVVFSERVATLTWLREQITKQLGMKAEQVEMLHGGLSDVEQQDVVESFKLAASPIRVLVTGDIASEGVNLHSQCHELVHFDIPWSLIRIEQRNGRIDRYGQRHSPQISTMLLRPNHDRFAGDVRVLTRLVDRENEAHVALGDTAVLMGSYSVKAEEDAIERALASGTGLDTVVPTVDEVAAGDSAATDPWLALLNLGSSEEPIEETVEQVDQSPEYGIFDSPKHFLHAALTEVFETPELPPGQGGVGWHDFNDGKYGMVQFAPSDDLKQRLAVLPQSYLTERSVTEEFKIATTRARAQEALDLAKSDASNAKGLWPEAHYLSPLHPVLDWASDRVLAKVGAQEIFAMPGTVAEPTVLVLGTLSNARGQVISMYVLAIVGSMVRPFESAAEAIEELGLNVSRFNTGSLPDIGDLEALIPGAVDVALGYMNNATVAAEAEARQRVEEWQHRASVWQRDADALVQRQDLKSQRGKVREEEEFARTMLPERKLARPLAVIIPEVQA